MIALTEKFCSESECERDNPQPITAFTIHRRNKDGLQDVCRYCHARISRSDYIPRCERIEPTAFQKTQQFKNLSLAAACLGMAKRPLGDVIEELRITRYESRSLTDFTAAVSVQELVTHALRLINRLVEAGERSKSDIASS